LSFWQPVKATTSERVAMVITGKRAIRFILFQFSFGRRAWKATGVVQGRPEDSSSALIVLAPRHTATAQ
jgi:hypothetical protein